MLEKCDFFAVFYYFSGIFYLYPQIIVIIWEQVRIYCTKPCRIPLSLGISYNIPPGEFSKFGALYAHLLLPSVNNFFPKRR